MVHELANKVSVTQYVNGHFEEIANYSTLPGDFKDESKLAGVRLSHDQRYLYISNRGHDSIAVLQSMKR